ncbi:hypothetical protein [Mucilaginibacter sp. KACC 22063]|uniref:hypothetical protein n=1 Tax=Mucilaginibacter sp. KACC 22063 TaxID=3025666 RepID=UPI002365F978|nr:hypothetical protein [Mucilaginibacter sp. KACC 22063]WDF55780.1 hypothetical protein PQ461_01730 [Mucilaginibacter sp. KACC 22063]
MKRLYKNHPALKGIAVLLVMMILLVQITEAFHHHQHPGAEIRHRQTLEKAQFQLRTDCAICHYFAHHYAPVQPGSFCYTFINTPVPVLKLTNGVFLLISGLHAILPNKGPPARFTISCTV